MRTSSSRCAAPLTMSAISLPAPGPMPNPWPLNPLAMKKPSNPSMLEMIGSTSGEASISPPQVSTNARLGDLRKPAIQRFVHLAEHLLLRRRIEHSFPLEGRGRIEFPARGVASALKNSAPKLQAQRLMALAECRKELGCEPESVRRQRMLKRSAVRDGVSAVSAATDRDSRAPRFALRAIAWSARCARPCPVR